MVRPILMLALNATLPLAFPAIAAELEPAERTMLTMRIAEQVFTSYGETHDQLPDLGAKAVGASRVLEALGDEYATEGRRYLTAVDGWKNPLRFVVTHDHVIIISFGADGRADVEYESVDSPEFVAHFEQGVLRGGPERDIILAGGRFIQRPRLPTSPAKQTMAEIRSIGTAIESYAVDNNVYPTTGGLVVVEAIAADLEPIYIRTLPRMDGWNHPYLFSGDTKHYVIVSPGADGVLEQDYLDLGVPKATLAVGRTATSSPDADIVFADGEFVRFPEAADRP